MNGRIVAEAVKQAPAAVLLVVVVYLFLNFLTDMSASVEKMTGDCARRVEKLVESYEDCARSCIDMQKKTVEAVTKGAEARRRGTEVLEELSVHIKQLVEKTGS